MKRLKVGIIGQGRSGRNIHAHFVSKLPELYEIAAVSDPMEERRAKAIADFGCEAFADYREMFARKDLDLIVNATPSHMHVPVSLEILENGFHVLCEKPLARRVSDVDNLIEASKKSGKLLAVYQQSRYSPVFEKIREIIDSGIIGRVVQANISYNNFARRWDWQTLQSKNGGNLLNTGPHPVDQALQFYGSGIMPNVTCIMDNANSFGDAEDYVKLILHGNGRPTVDVEISSCCVYPEGYYNIQGTNGGIKGTLTQLEWKYFKPEEAPQHEVSDAPLSKEDGTPTYCSEELKWYEDSWELDQDKGSFFDQMGEKYYKMLYAAIAEGAPLEITPEEVRTQVAVMEESFKQNPKFSNHTF
ncbi:Gfo/Idh/MocA family protein [Paenibacillus senegalensis]|uniref:Gfo/Idh/MocA family protein n=1 Tax=Paenibacillus senegalensis TaxID=1465766 RepID=UPI0002899807|nr:Gfo/Idh/MocA family oxidoreductase [Paenibacillus senegalensis]